MRAELAERLPDSSDEEQPRKAPRPRDPRRPAGAPRFDKDRVLATVHEVARKMPSFLTGEEMHEWTEWHQSVPTTLSEVPKQALPLPMQMPVKCNEARPAAGPASREQKQLMTYRNPGGRGAPHRRHLRTARRWSHALMFARATSEYNTGQRGRDALHSLGLKREDVKLGSTVALCRAAGDPWRPPGYGTAFYLMDVGFVDTGVDGCVSTLTGVYRLPMDSGLACDNEMKPWLISCCALHPWDGRCEKRPECVKRQAEASTTSKFQVTVDAATIFDTNITFTPSTGVLTAEAKRRLLQSAPSDSDWQARLGVSARPTVKKLRKCMH